MLLVGNKTASGFKNVAQIHFGDVA